MARIPCFHCHVLGLIPNWNTEILPAGQHGQKKRNEKHTLFNPKYEKKNATILVSISLMFSKYYFDLKSNIHWEARECVCGGGGGATWNEHWNLCCFY